MLVCKTEKRNSQCEHRQLVQQTKGLFGMCNLSASVPLAVNHNTSVTSGE